MKEKKVVTFTIMDDCFATSKEGIEFYRHTCEIAYKEFADELVKALNDV